MIIHDHASFRAAKIFDIPMRPMHEDQNNDIVLSVKRPATPVMVIIPLNFACSTLPTHRNRQVKVALTAVIDHRALKIFQCL